jgi:hypothetical protein
MSNSSLLPCDGCGQLADSPHISRRLERLAWSTRFRPIHIQSLLLSALAPECDDDLLYSPNFSFHSEAATVLAAAQISTAGKSPEAVQTEFQKLGLALIHVLECSIPKDTSDSQLHSLIEKQLPSTLTRIRRSLKPKRLLLISSALQPHVHRFHGVNLGCPVLPPSPGVFLPEKSSAEFELQSLRSALAISNSIAL